MDEFTKVLSIFAVVIAIAGSAAFIWAYYMASLSKAQLQNLRDDRDDLITRVSLLESEKDETTRLGVLKDNKILKLEREIDVLKGIVTHDSTIKDLIKAVQVHDEHVESKYVDYMEVNATLLKHVERLLDLQERGGLRGG